MTRTVFRVLAISVGALALITVQVASAAHPRPKSAPLVHMPLVPAYAECSATNRMHGPPLAFPSCNPPTQTSAQATVGTPDANGGAANSNSYLRLKFIPCEDNCPSPTFDDVLVTVVLNDIRCLPTGARCGFANASGPADYSGEMRLSFTARLSDHWNATAPGGGPDAATVQDLTLKVPAAGATPWACAQSGSTSIGSACSLSTSMNAQIPGAIRSSRALWELDAVRIHDGGADGVGNTSADNTLFARSGIFIP